MREELTMKRKREKDEKRGGGGENMELLGPRESRLTLTHLLRQIKGSFVLEI